MVPNKKLGICSQNNSTKIVERAYFLHWPCFWLASLASYFCWLFAYPAIRRLFDNGIVGFLFPIGLFSSRVSP